MKRLIYSFFLGILMTSCESSSKTNANPLAEISNPKVLQLAIPGKILYETYCANCHQVNGEGLGKLIPPLSPSDFMSSDVGRTVYLIKNGISGEIVVNGQSYNEKMPAFDHLTDLEIAQITTYLFNIWGNQNGVITAKEVGGYLK
jgi:cytochrome c551